MSNTNKNANENTSTASIDANAGRQGHTTQDDGAIFHIEIVRTNKKTYRVRILDGEQAGSELTIPQDAFEAMPHGMAGTLAKYRVGYVVSITADGRKSLSNGDELAVLLEQLTGAQVARIAEIALGLEEGELVRKYEKLNNGQVRMNSGNRLRAALKRGDIEIAEIAAAKAA